jgi:DNA-binding transcriptional ArsR family regulator
MASEPEDLGRRVHRALAHPLRVRILEAAADRDEVSPVELATELGESLGVVSYHVRTLADAGLLELSGTSFRRGAVKHHYRATDALGLTLRVRVSAKRAQEITQKVREIFEGASGKGSGDVELTVMVHQGAAPKK